MVYIVFILYLASVGFTKFFKSSFPISSRALIFLILPWIFSKLPFYFLLNIFLSEIVSSKKLLLTEEPIHHWMGFLEGFWLTSSSGISCWSSLRSRYSEKSISNLIIISENVLQSQHWKPIRKLFGNFPNIFWDVRNFWNLSVDCLDPGIPWKISTHLYFLERHKINSL